MKIGFIGAGNMATAIYKGMLAADVAPQDICITRRNKQQLMAQAREAGIVAAESNTQVAEGCDVVFLAVKPIMFNSVLQEIAPVVKAKMPLLVSMAAGISTGDIESALGLEGVRVVRIMPNVNAMVGESVTALCPGKAATEEDMALVERLMGYVGSTHRVEERLFATFTAIAGCSPAFVYMFINALAQGALKEGMPKAQATAIAAGAVLGSAKSLLESGLHPEVLCDKVCSPGGTTIEGVCTLKQLGFDNAVISAVSATIKKDALLKK